jgi:hypothetical protein
MARDYPNMSYCAFENTNAALAQLTAIVDRALEDGLSHGEFVNDMSEYEKLAFFQIRSKMAQLVEVLDQLEDRVAIYKC